jgi:hypothetical protein
MEKILVKNCDLVIFEGPAFDMEGHDPRFTNVSKPTKPKRGYTNLKNLCVVHCAIDFNWIPLLFLVTYTR